MNKKVKELEKTVIKIREIPNGWLLSIMAEELKICVEDKYFEAFPEILGYLNTLNIRCKEVK